VGKLTGNESESLPAPRGSGELEMTMKTIELLQAYLSAKKKNFVRFIRDVAGPPLMVVLVFLILILSSVLAQRLFVTMDQTGCS